MDGNQLRANDPSVDFAMMERRLAQEMANLKVEDYNKRREVEKICSESEELKELQNKIRAAYLNKERSAQISEHLKRKEQDMHHEALIEREMLRMKEQDEQQAIRKA